MIALLNDDSGVFLRPVLCHLYHCLDFVSDFIPVMYLREGVGNKQYQKVTERLVFEVYFKFTL